MCVHITYVCTYTYACTYAYHTCTSTYALGLQPQRREHRAELSGPHGLVPAVGPVVGGGPLRLLEDLGHTARLVLDDELREQLVATRAAHLVDTCMALVRLT